MGGLLLVLAIIAMVVGGSLWLSAFYRVEPVIPEQFRENLSKGAAFQTYVWSNLVPVSVRRRYMSSLVLWVMMLALMGGAVFLNGQPVGGMVFAGASVCAATMTLRLWIKHREQL